MTTDPKDNPKQLRAFLVKDTEGDTVTVTAQSMQYDAPTGTLSFNIGAQIVAIFRNALSVQAVSLFPAVLDSATGGNGTDN